MKQVPFSSPRSTARRSPRAIASTAFSISSGMPRSLAKWLNVPSGRMPSAVSVPRSTSASALRVPSPPPPTSSGGLARIASRAATSSASPLLTQLTCTARPCSPKSFCSRSFTSSGWPPPAVALMTTGIGRACGAGAMAD
jgi:hypothetical protein